MLCCPYPKGCGWYIEDYTGQSAGNTMKGGVTDMAYKIGDDCISCGSCASTCPVEAISEGAEHYEIDPEKCVECGACAAGCPVSAIEAP